MFSVAMKMSVGVDVLGVLSDEFENVDFAAAGPADGAYVICKSPNGGPDTGPWGTLARTSILPNFQLASPLVWRLAEV